MTWTVILILILVGFLFLLLEILVLPGTNIAGILGFVLIAIGIWQSFSVYGNRAGLITLIAAVILTVVFLAIALKSKTWNRFTLKSEIDGKVNVVDEINVKKGDEGITVSRLAPAGKALINNNYFEVHTVGGFVDQNTPVIVTKVEFNKIIVKPKTS